MSNFVGYVFSYYPEFTVQKFRTELSVICAELRRTLRRQGKQFFSVLMRMGTKRLDPKVLICALIVAL